MTHVLTCTGCGEYQEVGHREAIRAVAGGRVLASVSVCWCNSQQRFTMAESFVGIEDLTVQIRLLRLMTVEEREESEVDVLDLESELGWRQSRRSGMRCLECETEDIVKRSMGAGERYTHDSCGGSFAIRLRYEDVGDDDRPDYLIDTEGRRIVRNPS